jgi:hypothetical protein
MRSITFAIYCGLSSVAHLLAQTNVKSIGALGDGIHDDAPALISALKSGTSNFYFPKGNYLLLEPLVFDLAKCGVSSVSGDGTASLVMEGEGPALRFVGSHEGTASPTTVKPGIWSGERTPTVVGIEIIGRNARADGIEAVGTMQLTISKVVVRNARHAVHLASRNRNVVIADSHFYNNRGVGVYLDEVNLHQINITNTHISYNSGGGVVSHGGNVRNLQIGSCDIEGNHQIEGPASANIWLDSSGGSIGEVAIVGCTVQHTNKAPDSANIRIQGAGTDLSLERREGRPFTREGNITIGNNVFSDVQVNVDIRNARGVTVTGNTFWEGFEYDLIVQDSTHVVVTGNNFDRNPRYQVNGFANAECNGVVFRNSAESSFVGNLVSGVRAHAAAVEFSNCERMQISNNSVLDSDGAALRLLNVSRSVVSGNLLRDDRPTKSQHVLSLIIEGGADNLIQANSVSTP